MIIITFQRIVMNKKLSIVFFFAKRISVRKKHLLTKQIKKYIRRKRNVWNLILASFSYHYDANKQKSLEGCD